MRNVFPLIVVYQLRSQVTILIKEFSSDVAYIFAEFYDSLSLADCFSKQASISGSRIDNYDCECINQKSNEFQKQRGILPQTQENGYEIAIAEEADKIENDSRMLNEIFQDLAQIIHVSFSLIFY